MSGRARKTDVFHNHTELLHLQDDCSVELRIEV
jgi:hypothetical protein